MLAKGYWLTRHHTVWNGSCASLIGATAAHHATSIILLRKKRLPGEFLMVTANF